LGPEATQMIHQLNFWCLHKLQLSIDDGNMKGQLSMFWSRDWGRPGDDRVREGERTFGHTSYLGEKIPTVMTQLVLLQAILIPARVPITT